jgi:hypothetical protein
MFNRLCARLRQFGFGNQRTVPSLDGLRAGSRSTTGNRGARTRLAGRSNSNASQRGIVSVRAT